MSPAHRSSMALVGAMIVTGFAGCGSDAPTTPEAAESAARERSNASITLAFPGSIQSQAWGIDPSGRVVVGAYRSEDDAVHGFVFARGAFRTIDYPGAAFSIGTGINGRGEIVGWWEDANDIQHGYVQWHGVFTTTDVPDALSTRITGINASGDVVGAFDAPDGRSPGFVRRRGRFTAIEPFPGAEFTVAKGISSSGDVVGYWEAGEERDGFRPSTDSREVTPGVVLDFDAAGALVGIDIDQASRHLDLTSLRAGSVPVELADRRIG